MIKDVRIEQATSESIKAFYSEGCPHTCYGWIAYYKDQPACFAGVTLDKSGAIAFCDIKENDAPKMTVWRTAKAMFENIKSIGLPMIAPYCDPENQRSGQSFVKHLGFEYAYTYNGMEVFKCQS